MGYRVVTSGAFTGGQGVFDKYLSLPYLKNFSLWRKITNIWDILIIWAWIRCRCTCSQIQVYVLSIFMLVARYSQREFIWTLHVFVITVPQNCSARRKIVIIWDLSSESCWLPGTARGSSFGPSTEPHQSWSASRKVRITNSQKTNIRKRTCMLHLLTQGSFIIGDFEQRGKSDNFEYFVYRRDSMWEVWTSFSWAMPYIFVRWEKSPWLTMMIMFQTFRESVFKWWVAVQGLSHTELRLVRGHTVF